MMKRAFFLNAGDPDWQTTVEALVALDRAGVDWVELCVPYANPFTDGPVIRESHQRAMRTGVSLQFVLQQLTSLRCQLSLKVALMVDWSHSVRTIGVSSLLEQTRSSGVDAILLHGLPPREHATWICGCQTHGMARVVTIYPSTDLEGQNWQNIAFVYLVTRYGRAGSDRHGDSTSQVILADCVHRVRGHTSAPVFFGFGIDTANAVKQAQGCGADGVIVGSHFVDWLHQHVRSHRLHADALQAYADQFRTPNSTPSIARSVVE